MRQLNPDVRSKAHQAETLKSRGMDGGVSSSEEGERSCDR